MKSELFTVGLRMVRVSVAVAALGATGELFGAVTMSTEARFFRAYIGE